MKPRVERLMRHGFSLCETKRPELRADVRRLLELHLVYFAVTPFIIEVLDLGEQHCPLLKGYRSLLESVMERAPSLVEQKLDLRPFSASDLQLDNLALARQSPTVKF